MATGQLDCPVRNRLAVKLHRQLLSQKFVVAFQGLHRNTELRETAARVLHCRHLAGVMLETPNANNRRRPWLRSSDARSFLAFIRVGWVGNQFIADNSIR